MIDGARHLWVFVTPGYRIPVGWTERMVMSEDQAASMGGKQRGKY